jgi:5-methylcytosine-specific restriction endonuclease McrA
MPNSRGTIVLDQSWDKPATTWVEAIERYIAFIQVPAWRANAFHRDGSETRSCLRPDEASRLGESMLRTLDRLAARRRLDKTKYPPALSDLEDLARFRGRDIPRSDRCSARLHWHFQRAFLLNEAGYRCQYCGRSAHGVFDEDTGTEPRRTLRFEVDHRTTRRRILDPHRFDPHNLVIACRSCNTIKAEMTEAQFLIELQSLAMAILRHHESASRGPA